MAVEWQTNGVPTPLTARNAGVVRAASACGGTSGSSVRRGESRSVGGGKAAVVVSMSAGVLLLILLIRKSGLRPTHAVVSAFPGFYLARSQFAPTTQDAAALGRLASPDECQSPNAAVPTTLLPTTADDGVFRDPHPRLLADPRGT